MVSLKQNNQQTNFKALVEGSKQNKLSPMFRGPISLDIIYI